MSRAHRLAILEVLQGNGDVMDDTAVVVGYGLVIEMVTPSGTRGVVKITSDATGAPQPHYPYAAGYARALDEMTEFDDAPAS